MIENARSLNIAASALLLAGMIYILGPLYITLMTASQSYQYVVSNGVALIPGDQLLANVVRIFTETRAVRERRAPIQFTWVTLKVRRSSPSAGPTTTRFVAGSTRCTYHGPPESPSPRRCPTV